MQDYACFLINILYVLYEYFENKHYVKRYVSICAWKDNSYSMFFIMLNLDHDLPSFDYITFKTERKYKQTFKNYFWSNLPITHDN